MGFFLKMFGVVAFSLIGLHSHGRPHNDCDGSFSGTWNFKNGRAMTVQISGDRHATVVVSRPGVFTSVGTGRCIDGTVSFSGNIFGSLTIRRDNITGMVGDYAFNGIRDGSNDGGDDNDDDSGRQSFCDSKINGTWHFDRKPRWYNLVLDTGRRGRTIVYITHLRGSATVEGSCREHYDGASLRYPDGNLEIDRFGGVSGTISGYPYTGQVQR